MKKLIYTTLFLVILPLQNVFANCVNDTWGECQGTTGCGNMTSSEECKNTECCSWNS